MLILDSNPFYLLYNILFKILPLLGHSLTSQFGISIQNKNAGPTWKWYSAYSHYAQWCGSFNCHQKRSGALWQNSWALRIYSYTPFLQVHDLAEALCLSTAMFHILYVEFLAPAVGVFRFITECLCIRNPEATMSKTQKDILLKYKPLRLRNENMEGDWTTAILTHRLL